jgi:hypothetical protein
MDGYVSKPIRTTELFGKIEELLGASVRASHHEESGGTEEVGGRY